MTHKILIIDDDPSLQRVLDAALQDGGYKTVVAGTGKDGRHEVEVQSFDLVLLDLNLPDDNGLEILRDWRQQGIEVPVVVITAENTVENAITAMQAGAYDYIVKPFDLDDLDRIVDEAVQSGTIEQGDIVKSTEVVRQQLVGISSQMRDVYKTIGRTAQSDATALILGESGTGKELVARAIHEFSPRKEKPFIAVNTAAIPSDLLEAELFGYEKGAFTGATQPTPGKFREADGGTLLLDEIGDMPLALQGKLLRVLQERELTPLGGQKSIPIDVRILAATQVSLESAVESGTFRGDLYYRLNVIQIELPPLRDRPDDVLPLCEHFIAQMVADGEIPPKSIASEAVQLLERNPWPGNVRQLQNLIRRVALMSPSKQLDREAFLRYSRELEQPIQEAEPESFSDAVEARLRGYVQSMQEIGETNVWNDVMESVESVLIRLALEVSGGNQLKASELLGINRNTIRKKIKDHNIDPRSYK